MLGGAHCYFILWYQERIHDKMAFEKVTEENKEATLGYLEEIERTAKTNAMKW